MVYAPVVHIEVNHQSRVVVEIRSFSFELFLIIDQL